MAAAHIDLNADLGEGDPHDELLLGIVSSCNIACGGHTGDRDSMTRTVRLADARGVSIGAHPSYPDREGFGRRSRFLVGDELIASLVAQVEALVSVCAAENAELRTLKPHGALYNDARADTKLADMLATLAKQHSLILIGLPDSATEASAARTDVPYRKEGFVDRAYLSDGSLSPRGMEGAVIADASVAAGQAVQLAGGGRVSTIDGHSIALNVDTLCLHGDTPNADKTAVAVREALNQAGITIASPAHD